MEVHTFCLAYFTIFIHHVSGISLRLVSSENSNAGRLEVSYNGIWGTICDDGFGTAEATVACKELGIYNSDFPPKVDISVTEGSGKIWLDSVDCTGSQRSLADCSHDTWGTNDCSHSEDVGIICNEVSEVSLRLVSPLNNGVGRLEIYYKGEWGTVCDDSFGTAEATVACRQLGRYYQGSKPRAIQNFGYGSGSILLDDVSCTGSEQSLYTCSHRSWGSHNCGHNEDVGIICDERAVTMKLSSYSSGILQVYHSGSWGTVCNNGFGQVEASVVCKALGYQSGQVAAGSSSPIPIWLDDVQCAMTDSDLKDCKHPQWGDHDCTQSEVVGVQCYSFPQGFNARISFSSTKPGEGQLKLLHSRKWSGVCQDGFGDAEATVVCRMLGYSTYGSSVLSGFSSGSGSAVLKHVKCIGSELSINECLHEQATFYICPLVSIRCSYVRLASGDGKTHGRLELFYNNVWGTVNEDGFSNASASVVCRMLGQPHYKTYFTTGGVYGEGTGPVWLTHVSCKGDESDIGECPRSSWGSPMSSHNKDVGVVCSYPPNIHLEPNTGVLEVIIGGEIHIECVVDDANPPVTSYEWTQHGQRKIISNHPTFIKAVVESDRGPIQCVANNGYDSAASSAFINVLYPPILHCPEALYLERGESLNVECLLSSNPPSTIDVVRGNTEGAQSVQTMYNESRLSFQLPNVTLKDAGLYVVTVRNMMTDYNGHVMNGSSTALIIVQVQENENTTSDNFEQSSGIDMKVVAIATGSVAAVIIILLVVAISCWCLRSKGSKEKPETSNRDSGARAVTNMAYIRDTQERRRDAEDEHYYEKIDRRTANQNEPVYENTQFATSPI